MLPLFAAARRGRAVLAAVTLVAALGATACSSGAETTPPLRIGALFPLKGSAASLAAEEYRGAQIAAQLVNQAGGAFGRQIVLDVRDVESPSQVDSAVASLAADHVPVVIGAYSSSLSIPAADAVARRGMVYWETGAVADQVTGEGLPLVFRVGADGADLGSNSAQFILTQLAPRLAEPVSALRAFLVTANDAYALSVSKAVRANLTGKGAQVVSEALYDPYTPQWQPILGTIAAQHPDVLVLSSHIPDGIAFRRAFVAAHLHVKVFLGTTMAQCVPDFGNDLGADAVGVFGSDRPPYGFNAQALDGAARTLYRHFEAAWSAQTSDDPGEEGIAGFSATWALFADVLPRATGLTPAAIATAARALDLPQGSLPNGGGVLFSHDAANLGQNTRAAAVVSQWQGVRKYSVVWPPLYATGSIALVPLPV